MVMAIFGQCCHSKAQGIFTLKQNWGREADGRWSWPGGRGVVMHDNEFNLLENMIDGRFTLGDIVCILGAIKDIFKVSVFFVYFVLFQE